MAWRTNTPSISFLHRLGIVIFYAQFGAFKKCPYAKATAPSSPDYFSDCKENERRWMELGGEDAAKTWLTLLLAVNKSNCRDASFAENGHSEELS